MLLAIAVCGVGSMPPMRRPAMPSSTATACATASPARSLFSLTVHGLHDRLSAPSMTRADSTAGLERAGIDIDAVGRISGSAVGVWPCTMIFGCRPSYRGTPRGSRSGRRDFLAVERHARAGCRRGRRRNRRTLRRIPARCRKSRCASGSGLAQSASAWARKPLRVREIDIARRRTAPSRRRHCARTGRPGRARRGNRGSRHRGCRQAR